MNKLTRILIGLYVAVAVFTFGHVNNNSAIQDYSGGRFALSVVAAPCWPLYWSWELQRKEGK